MPRTNPMLRAAITGSFAAMASAAALLWHGRRETGSAAAPVNAPSQWAWGREAITRDDVTWSHTGLGYAIHHGASIFWGLLFEVFRRRAPRDVPGTVAAAVATTAVGNFVDFQLTPDRLTPGFEKRLSHRALFVTYAAFALGLAVGSLVCDRLEER
jgi:hypothetical protein